MRAPGGIILVKLIYSKSFERSATVEVNSSLEGFQTLANVVKVCVSSRNLISSFNCFTVFCRESRYKFWLGIGPLLQVEFGLVDYLLARFVRIAMEICVSFVLRAQSHLSLHLGDVNRHRHLEEAKKC